MRSKDVLKRYMSHVYLSPLGLGIAWALPEVRLGYRTRKIEVLAKQLAVRDEYAFGFDAEFTPVAQGRTALVQLASKSLVVLAHVHRLARLPPSLSALLHDRSLLKIGVGVLDSGTSLPRLSTLASASWRPPRRRHGPCVPPAQSRLERAQR